MGDSDVVANGKSRFLRLILDQKSISRLIAEGEAVLGNPLVLCTSNHATWHAGDLPSDCHLPRNLTDSIQVELSPQCGFQPTGEPQVLQSAAQRYRLLFCPLIHASHDRGYAFLVEVNPFSVDSAPLLKAFCDILAHATGKLEGSDTIMPMTRDEQDIASILEDNASDTGNNARLISVLQNERYLEVIVCVPEDLSRYCAPDITTIMSLKGLLKTAICFGFSQYIVAIVPFQASGGLNDRLADFLEQHALVAGVSYPLGKFSDVRSYFSQAVDMATVWAHTGKRIVNYSEHIFENNISRMLQGSSIESHCRTEIVRLKTYDDEHGTELLTTLKTYMMCSLNIRDTASQLNIHRNSALARIKKIKSIMSWDSKMLLTDYFSILLAEGQKIIQPLYHRNKQF